MKKIEKNELEKIQVIQKKLNSLVMEIGNIEFNRISMEMQYNTIRSQIIDTKNEESSFLNDLSEKYGDVLINPDTGEISEMKN
jgi:hypothetical protein